MKTSLQTKLFVWNSPSIFVSTIHQTVQKRSFKRDISLNNRKKKRFEKTRNRVKEETKVRRNMILTQSRRRTNESFLFLYHFVSRICIIDGVKVTSVLSNRSTIYQSIRALHSDVHQVQFAFQCRDSRTNSRRIVVVSLEAGRTPDPFKGNSPERTSPDKPIFPSSPYTGCDAV